MEEGRKERSFEQDKFILSKADKIKERLQESIREEVKEKIANILHEVEQLSDIEKLLLYLQLPTGVALDDVLKQKSHNNPLGKKADIEVSQTCTWIQTHLMEDPNVSLPKQEVYEEYKSFCKANNSEALCAADFGKVMKQVFPSVKPRRLGTRGNSRYCYSGLSKNLVVKSHTLPSLFLNKETSDANCKDTFENDVHSAACQLVLEWAEKLLEEKFSTVRDLAWYLVDNLCVDSRSVAAFTLLFFNNVDQPKKGSQAANLLQQVCGNRKRETQVHLQRKLQEKELIKEQKKKIQEQRQMTKSAAHKTSTAKKSQKTLGRKGSTTSQSVSTEKQISSSAYSRDSLIFENKDSQTEIDQKNTSISAQKKDDNEGNVSYSLQSSEKLSAQHIQITSNLDQTCDDLEMKQKLEKIPIPRKGTRTSTVCMPGIIAVSPVQITLLGPQTSPKPQKFEKKYKRIQPKSTTSKVSNKNSILLPVHSKRTSKKQANETNGIKEAKFSNLLNQAEDMSSEKSSEESNGTQILSSPVTTNTLSVINEKSNFKIGSVESELPVTTYSELGNNGIDLNGQLTFDQSSEVNVGKQIKEIDRDNSINTNFPMNTEKVYENFVTPDISNIADVMSAMKRHSEEQDSDFIASKKPFLENLNVKNAIAYLPTWENKDNLVKYEQTNKLLTESLIETNSPNDSKQPSCTTEVIHQLETEALREYFLDINAESDQVLFEKANVNINEKDVQQQMIQSVNNNHKQQTCNNASELSQLRMLLERSINKNNSGRNMKKSDQDTTEQSSVSSVLSSHSDSFDIKYHQNDEKELSEINQIILKGTNNKASENNYIYKNKLSTVSWTDNGDQSFSVQKDKMSLPETHQSDNLSEDQMISQIQSSLLSGENSADLDIMGTNMSQQSIFTNSSDNKLNVSDTDVQQLHNICNSKRNSAYTQIPSVPPSPNARRLAFNFLPISPRQTPNLENTSGGNTALTSPVPSSQFIATSATHGGMVSVAVGSSRPTSAASSPFVSPRGTPIPLSRSRHNSGQSVYSTPRQTPLQNFDSGVSSISTSPFISPQPTPLPVSRLRHNSSHSQGRTVTFTAVGSPHASYSQSVFTGSRSRHNSGPGIPHQLSSTMSPRSAPLSPMVADCNTQNQFSFSCVGDTPTLRSRHNSASSTAPLSPVCEQVLPASNNGDTQVNNDQYLTGENTLTYNNQELESQTTVPAVNDNGDVPYQQLKSLLNSKLLLPQNNFSSKPNLMTVHSELKQMQWMKNRQRHTSGPLLFQKSSHIADQTSQEIQLLLHNATYTTSCTSSNRSQSVPPYQVLQNLINQCTTASSIDGVVSKSHPTTPVIRNSFSFPSNKLISSSTNMLEPTGLVSSPFVTEEIFSSHITDQDEVLVNGSQSQTWENLNQEISGARRNITDILEQPQEDLEMTLDDLRDFDTDFSKLAQELEEMNPNDEGDLS